MSIRLSAFVRPLLAVMLWASPALVAGPPAGKPPASLVEDFDLFCRFVAEEYAYFDIKKTQWDKVCAEHRPRVARTGDRLVLIATLESALGELYDSHAHLGTSNQHSPRLIPTNAEVWAAWEGDAAFIREVREGSSAAKAGLTAGAQVLTIDGEPITAAARRIHPRFLAGPDPEASSWALQSALAGRQDGQPLRLSVLQEGRASTLEYLPTSPAPSGPLSIRRLDGAIGHIRFHNSLGAETTVQAFDKALDQLKDTKGLILDLRDTPSGGVSMVARGIMGRFLKTEAPYQVHELISEARATGIRRRWAEYVTPRGEPYTAPVVVLVGRWTSSMGEGLAIGLNATRKAPVVGTPMARLVGALGEIKLPASGIVVRIPTEKLFHVDGTPREAFVPLPARGNASEGSHDPALDTGLALLAQVLEAAHQAPGKQP